jgi:methionyl aminopeptidase
MWVGIEKVKAGVDLGTIGHAVETYVKSQGFNMVRFPGLTGHAIGQVHCEGLFMPFHGCEPGQGHVLQEGMVITIEPFICAGSGEAVLMPTDLRSVRTKDDSLARDRIGARKPGRDPGRSTGGQTGRLAV